MGKWAARLAEKTAAPPHGGTDKTAKRGLLSVLAVTSEGGRSEISARSLPVNESPADTENDTARPYRLTAAEGATAHADPWDDGAMARFQARAGLIRRHGFTEQDAQDLAERLHLRDVHADYRTLCLECSHYRRGRCGNYGAAGLKSAAIGHDLATMFQVCPGFSDMGGMK